MSETLRERLTRLRDHLDRAIHADGWTETPPDMEIADALNEAAAALKRVEALTWKSIETEPNGYEEVLISDGANVWAARHLEGEGWYEVNSDPSDEWGRALYPTHWMPLPSAPAPAGERSEG